MQENRVAENKMGVMPVGKLVVTMSLPIIISMLVQALYNIVDSMFVSRISLEAFNAVNLAFPAQNLMIGFATGTAVGVNALVSRALGAKDPDRANRVARNGVFLALCCYVIFLLFAIFGARTFFAMQTTNETVVAYGQQYLLIVCGLSFGIFGEVMFERLLTSTGKTIYTMISQGVGAIVNIIFDPICIFVLDMGVAGAAAATVLGQIVACCIAIGFNLKKNHELKLSFRGFRPEGEIIRGISAIGVPSIIMVAVGSVMTYLYNIILYNFTTGALYAQNVFGSYFKLNSLIFMPIFGLNNGMVPIISYNYGAARPQRVWKTIRLSNITAMVIMVVGFAIFQLFSSTLLELFDASETMLAIGVPALRIISVSFLLAGFCIIAGSVFQAIGNPVYSLIVSVCRQMVVLLPVAWLLSRTGRLELVWWSFPIAEVMSFTLSTIFLRRTVKSANEVMNSSAD